MRAPVTAPAGGVGRRSARGQLWPLAAAALALGFLVAPSLTGLPAAYADEPASVREAFVFADPEIVESSGLVDRGGLFRTVNDSGDDPRVFTVDPATGETVGVTTYAEDVVDVEALAPAGDGAVWVGDIGQNTGERDAVTVHRVPTGRGERTLDAPSYDLVYPGGASPDAESLLAEPGTGRLLVVTKEVFGGQVFRAPARLDPDGPNRLERVGGQRLLGIATDGAFLPDGRHLVLRNYGQAVFYSWPDLEPVGELTLPEQEQGEAISIAEDGRLHVSTEGQFTPVLFVALPDALRALLDEPEPSASASPTGPTIIETPEGFEAPEVDRSVELGPGRVNWLVGGVLGVGVVVVLLLALRPR